MSSYELLQPIVTKIDSALATYVTNFSSNLIGAIQPIVMTGLVLYFIWVGISYIKGLTEDTLADIGWHIFRVGIIVSIAMTAGTYQSMIATPLQQMPDDLTNTLLGGGNANGTAFVTLVDNILGTGIETATKYYSMVEFSPMADIAGAVGDTVGGWFGGDATAEAGASGSQVIAPLICGTAVLVGTILCLIVGCFWYLATKFLLALIVGIGALFIIALVWDNTKSYFGAWLNALLALMLINLMVTACFTIFADIFNSGLQKLATSAGQMTDYSELPIGDAIGIFFAGLLCCATLLILPAIASMLAQGGGAFGGVMGAVGGASRAVAGGVGASAKGAKTTAQAYNKAGNAVGEAYHSVSAKAYQAGNAVANYFRK